MPPQPEQSSSSALLGQFGALASMVGHRRLAGLKNPSDLYIGILAKPKRDRRDGQSAST